MSVKLTPEQLKSLGMECYTGRRSQEVLMERIGKVVFDGAMVRLISSLTEEQVRALDHAIETYQSFSEVMDYVERAYPQFASYLEEEQRAFVEAYVALLQSR